MRRILLNREFPEIRAWLLQIAAALDRVERAAGSAESQPRRQKIRNALEILAQPGNDRAERLQLLLSLPYDVDWQRPRDAKSPRAPKPEK